MATWTVGVDYTAIFEVEAEDEEEARRKAEEDDCTEHCNDMTGYGTCSMVEKIDPGECVSCGQTLKDEDSIAAGKCEDCLVIDNEDIEGGNEDD